MDENVWETDFGLQIQAECLILKLSVESIFQIIFQYLKIMAIDMVEQVSQEVGSEIKSFMQMFHFQGAKPFKAKEARLGSGEYYEKVILGNSMGVSSAGMALQSCLELRKGGPATES